MKIKDLIERLRHEDPEADAYFGEWSEPHQRDHFTDIKLCREPIRRDSLGNPYPPIIKLASSLDILSDTAAVASSEAALIIRKDFKRG